MCSRGRCHCNAACSAVQQLHAPSLLHSSPAACQLERHTRCSPPLLTPTTAHHCRQLQALAREADFYQLPGLADRIAQHTLAPAAAKRCRYDSLYLETGFNSIEGEALKEMDGERVG
jgi:hypothetical protein